MFCIFVLAVEISTSSVRILQLTDLHYGEGDWQDEMNSNAQENQLLWEHPDLTVVTGDLVSGYAWPSTQGWYNQSYQKFIKPFKKHNAPWALVLGNHDIEADLTGHEIMEMDKREALSLSSIEISSLSHSSNYYIPITHKGQLKLIVWAIDTGNRNHLEFGYDKIHEDQYEWIRSVQKVVKLVSGQDVPGIVFVHIPPPEFMDVWPESKGHRFENVACPGDHSRTLVKGLDNIIAFVAGHDHFNDYEGEIEGIKLYHGRKTGYAGVGPEPHFNKGARVFEYRFEDKVLDSWIREENGEVVRLKGRKGLLEVQATCAESVSDRYKWILILLSIGFSLLIALFYYLKKLKDKELRFTL